MASALFLAGSEDQERQFCGHFWRALCHCMYCKYCKYWAAKGGGTANYLGVIYIITRCCYVVYNCACPVSWSPSVVCVCGFHAVVLAIAIAPVGSWPGMLRPPPALVNCASDSAGFGVVLSQQIITLPNAAIFRIQFFGSLPSATVYTLHANYILSSSSTTRRTTAPCAGANWLRRIAERVVSAGAAEVAETAETSSSTLHRTLCNTPSPAKASAISP
jgi:hypothetical protein